MLNKDIAIVGFGFVGNSLYQNLKGHTPNTKDARIIKDRNTRKYRLAAQLDNVAVIDPMLLGTRIEDYRGYKLSTIFLTLPTPSGEDGEIDCSIVKNVLSYIENNITYDVIVIKSTITPDLVGTFCQNPKVVYNPEFLTERNAKRDFKAATFHVIGSNDRPTSRYLETVYREQFELNPEASYIHVAPEAASFVKYGINSWLATKVAWFNEFYDVVTDAGLDQRSYDAIIGAMARDTRVGNTHMAVPGWDGRRGFGGACFPKDIPAFLHYGKRQTGEFPPILKEAWNYNTRLRNSEPLLDREVEQHIEYTELDD